MEYMLMPLKKLYRFIEGRSGRKEYWMFFLLNFLIALVFIALLLLAGIGGYMSNLNGDNPANVMGGLAAMGGLAGAGAMLFLIIPLYFYFFLAGVASFGVTIRRLHDLGLSGWFYVLFMALMFIPFLNVLVWLGSFVVMALPGNQGPNKYGEEPGIENAEGVFE